MSIRAHPVHAIGWVFVMAGFVWLIGVQFSIGLAGPAVMMDGYPSVEKTNQYSGAQVRREVWLSTTEMANRIPSTIPPAVVMLAGAILIEIGLRKGSISQ